MTTVRLKWQNLSADKLLADPTLQAQWDALNAERSDLPFLSAYAVTAALRVFGRGNERLLVGHSGDTIEAMFLLERDGPGRWSTFQPSQLPLGAWVAGRVHSLLALARQLISGPLGASVVLSITQVDPLLSPREPDGPAWTSSDYIETGWIDVVGSFDDYWARRGKNLRANLRKQRNKLVAEGVRIEMLKYCDPQDMAPALERYGVLESAGWKGKEGTALHAGNEQGRFYIELLEQAAVRGEAKVFECRIDGRTVASNLCIRRGGILIVLKTTYDETIDKSLSPAFLLRHDELEYLFAARACRRIEFFGRFREWHSRWTESRRMLHHMTVYRWPWIRKLRDMRQRTPRPEAEEAT